MTSVDIPEALAVRLSTVENVVTVEDFQRWGVNQASLTKALLGNTKGWVYESGNRIVGFVMANSVSGELLVLALLPAFEKKGIGSALLVTAQQWLFAQGHEELFLKTGSDTALRAYGFYQHHGWQPTGQIEEGDEVFILSKHSD